MEGNMTVRSVTGGVNWTLTLGQEAFYDEDGERALGPPDRIVGGYASDEEQAHKQAQQFIEDLE